MSHNSCVYCGHYDEDYGCTCPGQDMWYSCPIEAAKPKNQKALEDYIKQCEETRNKK